MKKSQPSAPGKQKALPLVLAAAIAGFGVLSVASVLMGSSKSPEAPVTAQQTAPASPTAALPSSAPAQKPKPSTDALPAASAITALAQPEPVAKVPEVAPTPTLAPLAEPVKQATLPAAPVAVAKPVAPTPSSVAPPQAAPAVVAAPVSRVGVVVSKAPAAAQAPVKEVVQAAAPASAPKRKEVVKVERPRAAPKPPAAKPVASPARQEPVAPKPPVAAPVAAKDPSGGYVPLIIKPADPVARQEAVRTKRSGLSIVSETGSRVWLRINDTQTVMVEKGQEAPGLGKFLGMEKGQAMFERGVVADRSDGN